MRYRIRQPSTLNDKEKQMKEKDIEGANEQAASEQPAGEQPAATSAASTSAAQTQAGTHEGSQQVAVAFPYAAAGAAFTAWFNDKLAKLTTPTVMLGTKRARVVGLYEDGRLEVEIETEALEPEQQFVAFEAIYLDQLMRKIAALGL